MSHLSMSRHQPITSLHIRLDRVNRVKVAGGGGQSVRGLTTGDRPQIGPLGELQGPVRPEVWGQGVAMDHGAKM